MEILIPVIALGSLGLLFGLGLAVASKKFCLVADAKLEKVFEMLPGSNCGACGMAGCMGFAEGLVKGICAVQNCTVSTPDAKEEIAKVLGVTVEEKVKTVAVLHCNGGNKVKDRIIYQGLRNCIAANQLQGGQKACIYGCLGFGTCADECPFGAISMGQEGLPVVDEAKCTACGKCVKACPKNLFKLVAVDKKFYVACSSHDIGKKVMQACKVGCIACRKCEKVCPVSSIRVIDNLAVFDYDTCRNSSDCVEVCPTKVIKKRS
ncbi:RnfABCDGE type electron transport complex subunit B [Candidatus Omnitrophota bacterium]